MVVQRAPQITSRSLHPCLGSVWIRLDQQHNPAIHFNNWTYMHCCISFCLLCLHVISHH